MKFKRKSIVSLALGLSAFLTFIGAIFINLISNEIEPQLKFLLGNQYRNTIFLICICLAFILGVLSLITSNSDEQLAKGNVNTRKIVINTIKKIWVDGVYNHALQEMTFLELDFIDKTQYANSLLENDLLLENDDSNEIKRTLNCKILKIFDSSNQELLILGDPGTGKTIMLIELLKGLLERARRDSSYPIPFIVNLSSWKKNQTIERWLEEEFLKVYRIPYKYTKNFIRNTDMVLLLDGLDELTFNQRTLFISAINDFRRELIIPIVVCCRTYEYMSLKVRVNLQSAVEIKKLDDEKIRNFIRAGGRQLFPLAKLITVDESLFELARTPLYLSFLTTSFKSILNDKRRSFNSYSKRNYLLIAFLRNRLRNFSGKNRYSKNVALTYLIWIAKRMSKDGITELYLEEIQPSYLNPTQKLLYLLVSRLFLGMVINWIIFSTQTLFMIWSVPISMQSILRGFLVWETILTDMLHIISFTNMLRLKINYLSVASDGLFIGFIIFLIAVCRYYWMPKYLSKYDSVKNKIFINTAFTIFWFLIIFIITLTVSPSYYAKLYLPLTTNEQVLAGYANPLLVSLFISTFCGITLGRKERGFDLQRDIHASEEIYVNWKGLLLLPIIAFPSGISLGLLEAMTASLNAGLSTGLILVMLFILLGAIFWGFKIRQFSGHVYPNIGIKKALQNSIFAFFILMMFVMIFITLICYLSRSSSGLQEFISISIGVNSFRLAGVVGITGAIWYGFFDVVEHYIVRLFLSRNIPLNLSNFLDHCSNSSLLQKTGGGYRFPHKILQDYLARTNDFREVLKDIE